MGRRLHARDGDVSHQPSSMGARKNEVFGEDDNPRIGFLTEPATEAAKKWEGFGTSLKPSHEPCVLARKNLSEQTVAANVLKWGTGALNIDASRIGVDPNDPNHRRATGDNGGADSMFGVGNKKRPALLGQGRWPSNLILDEAAARELDAQSGPLHGAGNKSTRIEHNSSESVFGMGGGAPTKLYDRGGCASRFFFVAKASQRERGEGNTHNTVKPIALMRYLVRLVTPPGGVVLDPFTGSGSTGLAARLEGFRFIGIEKEAEYCNIARRRIAGGEDFESEPTDKAGPSKGRWQQLDLLG